MHAFWLVLIYDLLEDITDTLGCASCATFLFLPHFDVICDLLLNRRMANWNLFVNLTLDLDCPFLEKRLATFEYRQIRNEEGYSLLIYYIIRYIPASKLPSVQLGMAKSLIYLFLKQPHDKEHFITELLDFGTI